MLFIGMKKETMADTLPAGKALIIPSSERSDFITAYRHVKEMKSHMASNADLDIMLFTEDAESSAMAERMAKKSQYWWTSTIMAYPARGGRFRKGRDITDLHDMHDGLQWTLPAGYIPKKAFCSNTCIIMESPEIHADGKRIIITPVKIPMALELPANDDYPGIINQSSRFPMGISSRGLTLADDYSMRYVLRSDNGGLRPVARSANAAEKWYINASMRWNETAGIAYSETQRA